MKHIVETKMIWDISSMRYENLQRGMGVYSLCESCNNNTGVWYAKSYIILLI